MIQAKYPPPSPSSPSRAANPLFRMGISCPACPLSAFGALSYMLLEHWCEAIKNQKNSPLSWATEIPRAMHCLSHAVPRNGTIMLTMPSSKPHPHQHSSNPPSSPAPRVANSGLGNGWKILGWRLERAGLGKGWDFNWSRMPLTPPSKVAIFCRGAVI